MNTIRYIQHYLRREKALLLLPFIAIWLSLTLAPYCTTFWDSGIYVSMGNAIAKGEGAKYLGYTFKYPPVFPAMLALIIKPFGYNFTLMRLLMVAFAVGAIWLAYLIVRDHSNRWIAAGVMAASGFSYTILFECTRILSDLPYMFISLLAIRWIERYAVRESGWRSRAGCIAIGLMVVAFFTRILGATLFVAATAYLICTASRSWLNVKKAAAVSTMLVVVFSIWGAYVHLGGNPFPPELRQGISYGKEFLTITTETSDAPRINWAALWERTTTNAAYYQSLLTHIVLGKQQRFANRENIHIGGTDVVVVLMLLAGYVLCFVERRTFLEFYIFVYLLTYILWPALQQERFLVPIVPFLFYYLLRVIERLFIGIRWLSQRALGWSDRRRALDALAIIVFVGLCVHLNWKTDIRIIRTEKSEPYYSGRYGVLSHMTEWLRENTPDDTTLVTSEPAFVQILFETSAPKHVTHRKTFGFPWIEDPGQIMDFFNRVGVNYVISVPSGRAKAYLHPVLERYADRLEEVHRLGGYVIYRIPGVKYAGSMRASELERREAALSRPTKSQQPQNKPERPIDSMKPTF